MVDFRADSSQGVLNRLLEETGSAPIDHEGTFLAQTDQNNGEWTWGKLNSADCVRGVLADRTVLGDQVLRRYLEDFAAAYFTQLEVERSQEGVVVESRELSILLEQEFDPDDQIHQRMESVLPHVALDHQPVRQEVEVDDRLRDSMRQLVGSEAPSSLSGPPPRSIDSRGVTIGSRGAGVDVSIPEQRPSLGRSRQGLGAPQSPDGPGRSPQAVSGPSGPRPLGGPAAGAPLWEPSLDLPTEQPQPAGRQSPGWEPSVDLPSSRQRKTSSRRYAERDTPQAVSDEMEM